jgi:hypothetical protein
MELNAAEYEIFKKIKEDHLPSLEQKSSDSTMNALSEKYFPFKINLFQIGIDIRLRPDPSEGGAGAFLQNA